MFPILPGQFRTPEPARLRAALPADPGAFVENEPIWMATHPDWILDFINGLSDEASWFALEKAFMDARPISEFMKCVQPLGLTEAWNEFWVRCVAATVKNWAGDNQLNISISKLAVKICV
jgi:hypothetical protein